MTHLICADEDVREERAGENEFLPAKREQQHAAEDDERPELILRMLPNPTDGILG